MKKRLDMWWWEARPYLGHALMGMAIANIIAIVAITVSVCILGNIGQAFWTLSVWVLWLLISALMFGAAGITLYLSPYDRKEWYARHAVRHARGL